MDPIVDPTTGGSNRELIPPATAEELARAGMLAIDDRRTRSRWFDGRLLTARDLNREMQYLLVREADLGRAVGSGVATGLAVREGAGPQLLHIDAGHGITPSGELVLLQRALDIDLADIPRTEMLSGKFGLGRIPLPPARARSGLFALALRPVEFTANPTGTYPTSITGPRTVEDGDVIEATAVVLVPWPEEGAADAAPLLRRGRAARSIFVDGNDRGLSANLLPLAMVCIDNNIVSWIDAPMLRRELGADRDDLPSLGLTPRALRFAHFLQHQQHLADVVDDAGGRPFSAASVFAALPPAGPLPSALVNAADFSQSYFPPEIEVELAIIPEDELPALIEEALALPGFDFSAPAQALEASAVMVLAPVPRNQWRAVQAQLDSVTRPLRAAAPNLVAARKPLEILLRLRPPMTIATASATTSTSDTEWQRLASGPLWYVRRRNLAYREDVTGTALRLAGREAALDEEAIERLDELGLGDAVEEALERATPGARAEITGLLASPRLTGSAALTAATLGELSREATLDQAAALRIVAKVTAPGVGNGLARLDDSAIAGSPTAIKALLESTDWTSLDSEARLAPTDALPTLGDRLFRPHGAARPRRGAAKKPAAESAGKAAKKTAGKRAASSRKR